MENSLLNSLPDNCSTRDVARVLGLAVRSVQLMVDRGELDAWKTPGGHRRIARASVESWLARHQDWSQQQEQEAAPVSSASMHARLRVLLIEDSAHFQNLVRMLMAHDFPEVELCVAEDGIVGLAMAGELQPDVLIVDILLPGIDGATLIARMRSHPQFQRTRVLVLTSLDETQRSAYAFALTGLPVVHKPRLVQELPALLAVALKRKE
ncbi:MULTISPECIES: response regulator [Comamonas]|uniref:response regulator n=1 Tax=Comamonas TaxID=283 RepID=UPI000C19C9FD|nr:MULTISPECIES: response regulator [Comamonas]PIG09769.1 excisionase family DNA binding protein [Comamonas sp. 26]WQD44703.1 response regulator [Comamonas testosteroni]